jgi:hypothetical protein
MKFSLFPKTGKFYELLQQQSTKAMAAADLLNDVFSGADDRDDKFASINDIEDQGNILCREIVRQLSLTFITPIDKEDIHEINLVQEEILNLIKRISTRSGLYDFKHLKPPARWLVADLKAMVEEAQCMIRKLHTRKEIESHIEKIRKMKEKADLHLLVALGDLYEPEIIEFSQMVNVFKWTQIYDRIEEAISRVQYLAYVIEGVVLKYA